MDSPPEIRPVRDPAEFAAALAVRVAVFAHEQGGPAEDEPDAWDAAARHFVLLARGEVVGTARLYEPEPGVGKIGRVALLPEFRGRGWGALLLREVIAQARAAGFAELVLDSQASAVGFYRRFAFAAEGEEFHEAGLPHRRMRLRL